MSRPTLCIVVPIFNESDCLPELLARLDGIRPRLEPDTMEILFVNDGSTDGTAQLLEAAARLHSHVKVIHFSRNFGHQAALTAGLDYADAEFVCVIDGDLQDPPEIIPDMLARARQGYDVVYGQRRRRAGDSFFKRATAAAFYRVLATMCRVEIPVDTGDFRLVTRRVVEAFRRMRETHRFIRGMVPWLGFSSSAYVYDRHQRAAGKTKFPLMKMLHFAMDAILSFSNLPLRVATLLGLLMTGVSVVGMIVVLYLRLFTRYTVPGISAVIFLILLTSGVQCIILGMVGGYIGRIFEQSKNRPLYVVATTTNVELQQP